MLAILQPRCEANLGYTRPDCSRFRFHFVVSKEIASFPTINILCDTTTDMKCRRTGLQSNKTKAGISPAFIFSLPIFN